MLWKRKVVTCLFISLLFITANESPGASGRYRLLDVNKINLAWNLLEQASYLKEKGQTVKAKRTKEKAERILDSLFKKGTIISCPNDCSFRRIKEYNDKFSTREFSLSCMFYEESKYTESPAKQKLIFKFVSNIDKHKSVTGFHKKWITSSALTEKFESAATFSGAIQIAESVNIFNRSLKTIYEVRMGNTIIINCKILRITPSKKPFVKRESNSPVKLLQRLENGEEVSRSKIIRILRSMIEDRCK